MLRDVMKAEKQFCSPTAEAEEDKIKHMGLELSDTSDNCFQCETRRSQHKLNSSNLYLQKVSFNKVHLDACSINKHNNTQNIDIQTLVHWIHQISMLSIPNLKIMITLHSLHQSWHLVKILFRCKRNEYVNTILKV